ncbi:hypothetical protein ANCDUO_00959 [Ancylostoma duodenale]|uniref:Uncharacterized protein n=1 Tax=Ancylostoma duodenale TaxID=51022 RepID=A0A0C2DFB9_9BILA|nr:hypothetical protein ANCDUO_00959 [Ancylostoma duodenale]
MQARKIRNDVIGLTETRRHPPLNATFDTGEELFFRTCNSRGVGGDGVLVNTNMVMNIDSFEQLTTRIGRLRLRRCGSIPAVTIFVAYAPTSSYDEEKIEAFYMDLEKFYREDHTFYKKWSPKPVINWGLCTLLAGLWEDAAVDNIEEEYDRLVQHLRDSTKKAEGTRTTKRRLSYETLELIRQRRAARAAGNYQLTSELPKRCREAIKEDLKERRAAVLTEAAKAGKSIRKTRRDSANRNAKINNPPHANEGMNTKFHPSPKVEDQGRDAAGYAKLSNIRWAGEVMRLNDNRWTRAVSDGLYGTLSAQLEGHRLDGQTSSRSTSREDTMLFVPLELTESIERLWHLRGTNGGIAGTRSVYPKIDGSQGDQESDAARFWPLTGTNLENHERHCTPI